MLDRADPRVPTPRPRGSSLSPSAGRVAAARMLAADHPLSLRTPAAAGPPEEGRPRSDELARLRKRVDQQEHSLTVMAQAISALRDGSRALREENRQLRLELQAARR